MIITVIATVVLAVFLTGCGREGSEVSAGTAGTSGESSVDERQTAAVTDEKEDKQETSVIKGTDSPAGETGSMPEKESQPEETDSVCQVFNDPGFVFPEKGVRPVVVMIDNEGQRPLPQGGLDEAQIVYEMVVEWGITRLMPVFWNVSPAMIGPVRSSRHYFIDYAMEHDAIYVHFGWSPMAKRDISRFGINNANGVANGGWIFWNITDDPGNWQDSYTSMENIQKYVKSAGYRTETDSPGVFEYREEFEEPSGGVPANSIELVYSAYKCGYDYDEDAGLYKRTRAGKPHMERNSGKQLECANIIIQYVRNYTIEGDKYGRQQLETTGTGTGYYITCGKAVEITWSKEYRSAQTVYTDAEGNRIVLNPGRTWIQVMPLNAKTIIEK